MTSFPDRLGGGGGVPSASNVGTSIPRQKRAKKKAKKKVRRQSIVDNATDAFGDAPQIQDRTQTGQGNSQTTDTTTTSTTATVPAVDPISADRIALRRQAEGLEAQRQAAITEGVLRLQPAGRNPAELERRLGVANAGRARQEQQRDIAELLRTPQRTVASLEPEQIQANRARLSGQLDSLLAEDEAGLTAELNSDQALVDRFDARARQEGLVPFDDIESAALAFPDVLSQDRAHREQLQQQIARRRDQRILNPALPELSLDEAASIRDQAQARQAPILPDGSVNPIQAMLAERRAIAEARTADRGAFLPTDTVPVDAAAAAGVRNTVGRDAFDNQQRLQRAAIEQQIAELDAQRSAARLSERETGGDADAGTLSVEGRRRRVERDNLELEDPAFLNSGVKFTAGAIPALISELFVPIGIGAAFKGDTSSVDTSAVGRLEEKITELERVLPTLTDAQAQSVIFELNRQLEEGDILNRALTSDVGPQFDDLNPRIREAIFRIKDIQASAPQRS